MEKIVPVVTAVTEVYGSGQKVTAAVLEYPAEICAEQLTKDSFAVENRTVTCLHVSGSPDGLPQRKGRFVRLTLDAAEKEAEVKIMLGAGPHGRMAVRSVPVCISQREEIAAADGTVLPPFEGIRSGRTDNGTADRFKVCTFTLPGTDRQLSYNLFCPDGYETGGKYPLVLFIHDAGSCSDDVSAALVQGNGAVVWAGAAEQKKRPCFVAAPHYPSVCANDAFEVTWEADATAVLIKELIHTLPVEENRIYGTGQSMGCMMLCELTLRYPDLFAGCLLAAGQWNPATMSAAAGQNLWAVVAQKDVKAFPIMGACFEAMERTGEKVVRGHVDARADAAILREYLERQKAAGGHLFFTWFEGDSVLPPGEKDFPGAHHIHTWEKAYDMEVLREWLFEQEKKR